MVVQHNITAMNANRMLGVTTTGQAKSTEKLSSGYRINRAADDAAGLSISEKMRKQIRGLSQASTNAQDGISCVQTAEGALTEVHSMLQRMNELAVQAGNGTMSEDDRQNVQDEIDQLVDEIDRVSETTKFNETYLLKGADSGTKTYTQSYKTPVTNEIALKNGQTLQDLYAEGGTTKLTLDQLKADYLEVDETGAIKIKEGKKLYSTKANTTDEYGDQVQTTIKDVAALTELEVSSNALLSGNTGGIAVAESDLKNYFDEDGTYKGGLFKKDTNGDIQEVGAEQIADYVKVTQEANVKDLELSFQVGADTTTENKITVTMQSMSAKSIGVDELKVTGKDSTNADAAVNTISDAIKQVSKQRSALGAVQNRLEHTIANLDNVVENTTSAESRIRDTDMAEEMVSYSKNNILMQAGQSMLAQANQQNQGVLSLLQ